MIQCESHSDNSQKAYTTLVIGIKKDKLTLLKFEIVVQRRCHQITSRVAQSEVK